MIQKTLLALCDPTRREILKMLAHKRLTVGEICSRFDISPPAISRHLALLRESELVCADRSGKFVYYSLKVEPILDLDEYLRKLIKETSE